MQDSVCLSLVAGYPAKRKYKAVRGRMPNRGLASGKSCHRHSQGRMGQAARSWFKCQDAAMGKLSKCGSTGWNAGIWLYWSFLQKMVVPMTKSDSSTFSSRLFVSQWSISVSQLGSAGSRDESHWSWSNTVVPLWSHDPMQCWLTSVAQKYLIIPLKIFKSLWPLVSSIYVSFRRMVHHNQLGC